MSDTGKRIEKTKKPIFVEKMCKEVGYNKDMEKHIKDSSNRVYCLYVGEVVVSEIAAWNSDWLYSYTLKQHRGNGYAKELAREVIRGEGLKSGSTVNSKGKKLVESVLKDLGVSQYKKNKKKGRCAFSWEL